MQSVPGRNVSARSRERERERGIPETITSLNGLDLSPASSFFFPPSSFTAVFLYTVSFPLTEVNGEKEKGKRKKLDSLDTKVALAVYSPHLIIFFLLR